MAKKPTDNTPLKPHQIRRAGLRFHFEGDTAAEDLAMPTFPLLDTMIRTEAQRVALKLAELKDPLAQIPVIEGFLGEFYSVAEDHIRRVGARFDGRLGGRHNRDDELWGKIAAALQAEGADPWKRCRPAEAAGLLARQGISVSEQTIRKVRKERFPKPPNGDRSQKGNKKR